MKSRTFQTDLWLPRPIQEVFAFFSNSQHLDCLTPSWLHFRILTPAPVVMGPGALIDYRLRLHGVPLRWRTEITAWEPPRRFVDVQRHGPYRRWVHEHLFEVEGEGTRVRDRVEYAVPGGPLEPLLHRLLVRPDLWAIFAYRREKLVEIHGRPG